MIIPPRLKSLSTAELDAGTLNALSASRYSLPKPEGALVLMPEWKTLLIIWLLLIKIFLDLLHAPESWNVHLLHGKWSIFHIDSKTCLQHYVQTIFLLSTSTQVSSTGTSTSTLQVPSTTGLGDRISTDAAQVPDRPTPPLCSPNMQLTIWK